MGVGTVATWQCRQLHSLSGAGWFPSRVGLVTRSKASLQTMQRENPQVAAAFQEFIICLLADRLISAYQKTEELLYESRSDL